MSHGATVYAVAPCLLSVCTGLLCRCVYYTGYRRIFAACEAERAGGKMRLHPPPLRRAARPLGHARTDCCKQPRIGLNTRLVGLVPLQLAALFCTGCRVALCSGSDERATLPHSTDRRGAATAPLLFRARRSIIPAAAAVKRARQRSYILD